MNIYIKKLRENAILPSYQTPGSAGADLSACLDAPVTIGPGETVLVPSGLAVELPEGYAGLVFARSGLASKRGVAPANKVGVIDSDYRGELIVPLHNHGRAPEVIGPGQRVAQMLFVPVARMNFIETAELGGTARGEGGFGSTGTGV
ncbi:MAG: dUTP diphosphatase [Oscillospiraceae bacterium]|jgi:dUTP pyrophosphatase|nr:dUTP diphosphatase [Oscillospiraceae bacterium]